MAFCGKCGAQLDDSVRFCPACGAEVPGAASAQNVAGNQQGAASAQNAAGNQQGAASAQNGAGNQQGAPVNNVINSFTNTADSTSQYSAEDINANKGMAILSYISWLVLIPLFAAKTSPFAKYHVNQGLVLALFELAWGVIYAILNGIVHALFVDDFWGIISPFGRVISIILGFVTFVISALALTLAIMGIVNAANGKAKELPLIGKIKLYK